MKNIFLSLMIFVVMSLLHTQFTESAVKLLKLPGGSFGMYSIFILIMCSIITGIGLVTVIIFKRSYGSILKIAILFEIIYLFFILISGNNPFLYFSDSTNENLLMIMMYGISGLVFLLMFFTHLFYMKIISSKNKNLS
ncbi:hypothetical protein BA768_16960 [Chryseobacterium sp. CBo1]|uniref:hypothetical protein n=1 Tax=Chryseobacterium sp. CBo1 TaxID=1869230 RepID=UPI000810EA03|nr:hypothetical protein [Chryseobacterium sp. CBo1]OCK51359.1 hypothetical protein BA768_16960 [Chryseobacterium sp. CBo1]